MFVCMVVVVVVVGWGELQGMYTLALDMYHTAMYAFAYIYGEGIKGVTVHEL